jgi:Ca-activated chloride channel homolog
MKYIGLVLSLVMFPVAAALPVSSQTNSYVTPETNLSGAKPVASGAMVSYSEAEQAGQDSVLTIKKRVDEVNVLFIATDKHGKFVRNLNQTDFSILDDHKPPQSILEFHRETDLPLQMGLLVDVSGSVRGRFDFEQQAATGFLQHVLRPHFDKAFVMGFNSHSQITQDFTDNATLLSKGIQSLHNGGGTALYDAVYRACRDKFLKDHPDHPVRKAIIIVSDGEDNQSEYSRTQAIEMAQRAEVIIYAISTDDSGLILRGDRVLEQLAEATGGRAFFPYKMKDITHAFAAIEDELRSQYAVSYKPADFDADGRYRTIEITSLKKDLQVRARKGYFAPRQ